VKPSAEYTGSASVTVQLETPGPIEVQCGSPPDAKGERLVGLTVMTTWEKVHAHVAWASRLPGVENWKAPVVHAPGDLAIVIVIGVVSPPDKIPLDGVKVTPLPCTKRLPDFTTNLLDHLTPEPGGDGFPKLIEQVQEPFAFVGQFASPAVKVLREARPLACEDPLPCTIGYAAASRSGLGPGSCVRAAWENLH
jgi:hypothetical protein